MNLDVLYLDYNQIFGAIPFEIGNLTALEYLYLDFNKLTGEIPESICDLSIYWGAVDIDGNEYFNIGENQLCPPYPECLLIEHFIDLNDNGLWDEEELLEDYGIDGLPDTDDYGEGNGILDDYVGEQTPFNCN